MKDLLHLTEKNFELDKEYEAIVIDNRDTLFRSRLQVNIVGITNNNQYPWAEVESDFFGASNSTAGFSSVPKIGTHVYVKFKLNNPSFPIVCGLVRGNSDSANVHKVRNLNQTIYQTRLDRSIGPELPPLNNLSVYPNNNVIETSIGVIEIDDTTPNARISIQHKNGSYYEIRPNGDIQIKSTRSEYHIVEGSIEEYIDKCVNRVINRDLIDTIAGSFQLTATGGLTINNDVKLNGGLEVRDTATVGNLTSKGEVADSLGNLSSLRTIYNSHEHSESIGSTTTGHTSDPQARLTDFLFTETSLGCSLDSSLVLAPAFIDTPSSYYIQNIQPMLSTLEVPESYPQNSEQVDELDNPDEEGVLVNPQTNPFEFGEQLLNLGDSAWRETGSNPNIGALWDEIAYDSSIYSDSTAWCAIYASAVLKRSGNKYIKSASSRVYANYGVKVDSLNDAKTGDIIVFYRNGRGSVYGHVGFYAGSHNRDYCYILGGNQSNSLNVRGFRISNPSRGWGILAIRRAVSAQDGVTTPPDYNYTVPSNVLIGNDVT